MMQLFRRNRRRGALLAGAGRAVLAAVAGLTWVGPVAAAAAQYAVTGAVPAPDALWDYATVDTARGRLYVARAGGVLAMDLATRLVTPVLVSSTSAHVALPLPDGQVAVANAADGTVSLFDGDTGKVSAVIPAGEGPDSIAFDPVSGLIAVTDQDGAALGLSDPKTGARTATIALAGSPEAVVADGHGKLFDNIEDHDEIAVIDPATRSVVAHYPLPRCHEPTGLAYDPGGDLLVSACRNGVVNLVEAKTGKIAATLDTEPGPDTVMVDPGRHLAFVPSGRGVLTIIDLSPGQVGTIVQRLKTVPGCRTGAVDPRTGIVYLPAADLLPSTDPKKHTIIAGTFRILIVEPVAAPG
jgi:YVTN family beta-propeller protein